MRRVLPRLTQLEPVQRDYEAFTEALAASGFAGDIKTDYATRLVTATDNSVYQLLPQGVVYPRDAADVGRVLGLVAEPRFHGLSVAARGGGTGTNGQSLTTGLVLDVSRYMDRILAVNLEEGWVEVQPGVVLDDLNRRLEPHGVFFAPNLSPSSRATLGGMISTDACGKGSRVYGKTSEHVLRLDLVLADGTAFTAEPVDDPDALTALKERNDRVGEVHRTVHDVVVAQSALIEARFPKLKRFLTGYNLARVRTCGADGDNERFDLNYLITGSEGTLAVVTRARLRLTPLPTRTALFVLKYPTFSAALDHAQILVESDPTAIETIDETVLSLARKDIIWHDIAHLLQDSPDEPHTAAVNLVEYAGNTTAEVEDKATALREELRGAHAPFVEAANASESKALWNLRKKGVGLLGAKEGRRKPVAFVEDTVVPPENLPAYVAEFRAVLDKEGLFYGMFGHIDVGCLHVRPALDLTDPEDEAKLRRVSDAVAALTRKYGGLMWGEHGRGFRSEYLPDVFGEELYGAMRRIKTAFDPHNQLNPGKICTPLDSDAELVSVDGPKRGHLDRQVPDRSREAFLPALECNGNGACFNTDPDHVMCPSSKITRDRIHSPKGRAGVMREWLRQLANAGYDPVVSKRAPLSLALAPVRVVKRWFNGLQRWFGRYDYNHEVNAAMEGCLACKACATQCPIKVDVPTFRSEFFAQYYSRYPRPVSHVAIARLESALPWLAAAPRLANAVILGNPLSRWLTKAVTGIVDSPLLSPRSLHKELRARGAKQATPQALAGADPNRTVVLVPDAFTTFYEAPVGVAVYEALTRLGYDVFVMPYFPNGKGLHVKGYMRRFETLARRNAATLVGLQDTGVPLVGVDPAVTLTYRDEYLQAVPDGPRLEIALPQEFLAGALVDRDLPTLSPGPDTYYLFGHCTERTAAPETYTLYRQIFETFGLTLAARGVGCCGMCGAFGHEKKHLEESRGIFDMSWARALDQIPSEEHAQILADGHSCRSQVKRFRGLVPRHPLQVLAERLPPGGNG